MNDDDFMTLEEFTNIYGQEMGRRELVTLVEHDGERMWKREKDGWYRLGEAQCG